MAQKPITVAEMSPEQRAHWDQVKAKIQELAQQRASERQAQGARNAAQARKDNRLLAQVETAPLEVSHVPPDEDARRAVFLFRRNYLTLLSEPAVMANFREKLSGGDAKSVRDILVALTGLLAEGGVRGAGGATRITLVNKVPRPPAALDITPKGD